MTSHTLPTVSLGTSGPRVSALALGAMGMSGIYGQHRDEEGVATIHAALEQGVTLIDTGDFYGVGHNELLIRQAIQGRRDRVQLSVKFGALRAPDGGWGGVDNRPAALKNFLAYSLTRLGVEVIDVYRPARLDPSVPIEDTIGAIKDLIQQGYVRHIGLSEVGVDTIRRAHAVHPIADLQIEYSLVSRGPEAKIFPVLRELGIGATLYGVLSRGLLSGSRPKSPTDFRSYLPRFAGEDGERNRALVERFRALAEGRGMTATQLAIAWARARQPDFVTLVGARTPAQLHEALGAATHTLSAEDLQTVEAMFPAEAVAGTRYGAAQMAHLDSEH